MSYKQSRTLLRHLFKIGNSLRGTSLFCLADFDFNTIHMTTQRWQEIYDGYITKAKSKIRNKDDGSYYEKHHILPKCMNGSNDESNLVTLLAREHLFVHWLLTKIHPNNHNISHALWCMCNGNRRNKEIKLKISATIYEKARIQHLKFFKVRMTGAGHPASVGKFIVFKPNLSFIKTYESTNDAIKDSITNNSVNICTVLSGNKSNFNGYIFIKFSEEIYNELISMKNRNERILYSRICREIYIYDKIFCHEKQYIKAINKPNNIIIAFNIQLTMLELYPCAEDASLDLSKMYHKINRSSTNYNGIIFRKFNTNLWKYLQQLKINGTCIESEMVHSKGNKNQITINIFDKNI